MDKIITLNIQEDPELKTEIKKYGEAIYSRNYLLNYLKKINRPLKIKEILAANPLKHLNQALKNRLRAMIKQGQLLKVKHGYTVNENNNILVEGYVVTSKSNYGFLVVDSEEKDLFLNPKQMNKVLEYDKVQARIIFDKKGRKEACIIKVINRAQRRILGQINKISKKTFFCPANDKLKPLPILGNDIKRGTFAIAEIVEQNNQLHARIVEILNNGISLTILEKLIIENFKLPTIFPKQVLTEANTISTIIEKNQREDWQHLPFVTIDGEDAKDFDDAVYGQKTKTGYQLWVAIADVAHYVLAGNLLDQEAQLRGNSVYFPEKVLPMLPEILSNNLCSLKPMLPRLAIGCCIDLDKKGNLLKFRFAEVIIKSHARLTYDQVYDFLENNNGYFSPNVAKNLKYLREIYYKLKKIRLKRHALEFNRQEVKLSFQQNTLISITPKLNHYVYQMIEECMLITNVCAANWLKNFPAIYRVHTPPKADKLADLKNFLSKLGIKLGKEKTNIKSEDYANLIKLIKGRKDENLLQLKILRSLKQACYNWKNLGHFALNYSEYLHFTSPIRRYCDLYNHRLIKAKLKNEIFIKPVLLEDIPKHCSETERRADEASQQILRWYQCQYLSKHLDKNYIATIVGINESKLWIELKAILIEGWILTSSIGRTRILPNKISLQCLNKSKIIYTIGDEITVRVQKIDIFKREIIFQLV